ncbi:PHP-associated domain-containing protein [Haladaptatus sp. DJG-WS-42]|uniref:PHP-associated domain-containing protein n=2 Tax=Haladaptatus sp. DJG-WS-42 TaxID=3120516 RepID=UPI0030D2D482
MSRDEFRVDMHVKILDEKVVARAKARGIDALVYAPHFTRLSTINARAAAFSDDDLLVIPGRELFTGDWKTRKHILALGLSDPIPDFITLDGAMTELARQNAAVLVPHPEFLTVSMEQPDIERFADRIHGIEAYNPKHWPHQNRRAEEIIHETGISGFTSSYAHMRGTIGEAWTTFDERFETVDNLVAALRDDVPRKVMHRTGIGHRLRCLAEFAHLGYENSYGKIDRLFLSGTEPTHPDHIAYGGRFDDISVY